MKQLELTEIGMDYGGVRALDDVTLCFRVGAITSLVGPNGAGKSSLLDIASGLQRPTRGRGRVDDSGLPLGRPHSVARLGIRRSFQTSRVMPGRTVQDNVLLGTHGRVRLGFLQDMLGTPSQRRLEREMNEAAMEAVATVGLTDVRDRLAGSLSYGQLRLMEIARALAGRPELLLLDEPAAGLNSREADRLGDLLLRLVSEHGMGIVLVEHNLGLVRRISDQMYVLNLGRLIAGGAPDNVTRDPVVIAAYTGGTI